MSICLATVACTLVVAGSAQAGLRVTGMDGTNYGLRKLRDVVTLRARTPVLAGVGDTAAVAFRAFGRRFSLDLKPFNMFAPDCTVTYLADDGEHTHACRRNAYRGMLRGHPRARVTATIGSGQEFYATIRLPHRTYVIAPRATMLETRGAERQSPMMVYRTPANSPSRGRAGRGSSRARLRAEKAGGGRRSGAKAVLSARPTRAALVDGAPREKLSVGLVAGVGYVSHFGYVCSEGNYVNPEPRCTARAAEIIPAIMNDVIFELDHQLSANGIGVVFALKDMALPVKTPSPIPTPTGDNLEPLDTPLSNDAGTLLRDVTEYKDAKDGGGTRLAIVQLFTTADFRVQDQPTEGIARGDAVICQRTAVSVVKPEPLHYDRVKVSLHEFAHILEDTTLHDEDLGCGTGGLMSSRFESILSLHFSSCARELIAGNIAQVKLSVPGCFQEILCGDVDDDGFVSSRDALHALETAVDLRPYNPFADVAPTFGIVTASDALDILRRAVGLGTDIYRCGPP